MVSLLNGCHLIAVSILWYNSILYFSCLFCSCGQSNSNLEESDQSLKLIETRSEPDIAPITDSLLEDSPVTLQTGKNSADDSFIKMEQMVELSMPLNVHGHEERDKEQLDNTLEEIEYILNHGHAQKPHNEEIQNPTFQVTVTDVDEKVKLNAPEKNCGTPPKSAELECYNPVFPPTPFTPLKHNMKEHEALTTPSVEHKIKTPTFKTPANVATKKFLPGSAIKRTPLKTNAYQHISSPIAAYIKNCPQVPLVKDVRPNKPLPGPSSIPKFVKSHSHKENVILPPVAYRSAKKTQMVGKD